MTLRSLALPFETNGFLNDQTSISIQPCRLNSIYLVSFKNYLNKKRFLHKNPDDLALRMLVIGHGEHFQEFNSIQGIADLWNDLI